MSQVGCSKLVNTLFFLLKKAGSPLKSVSSISSVPTAGSQPPCTSLGCPLWFSFLGSLSSLFGLPIPVCSPVLYCNDTSQQCNFWPSFYTQTSVLVFWHLHLFNPTLPGLLFKSTTTSPAPLVWAFFPPLFEFGISLLFLKACLRDTSFFGTVQCSAKPMLNDY